MQKRRYGEHYMKLALRKLLICLMCSGCFICAYRHKPKSVYDIHQNDVSKNLNDGSLKWQVKQYSGEEIDVSLEGNNPQKSCVILLYHY
ncbi:TPA: hypothetical protein DCG86_07365 [Candidatus Marinimicrobia bacterium]|nr:hypothetical protein [Candidatus Neomarinimicrobiota bacterium]HBY18847.1 hypothetical protein [Candidatus Neomarinimicrobiota bacterium]